MRYDLILRNGTVIDFQTTRDTAGYLAPYYQKAGMELRSHGCANADAADSIAMLHPPNLVMEPGKESVSFDDLVRDTKKGLAFIRGSGGSDFQSKNGAIGGDPGSSVREIVNGKLGRRLTGAAALYQSSQLWKSLVGIGGAQSAVSQAMRSVKGQPEQSTLYTSTAVPVKMKDVTIIDATRRM